MPDITVTGVRLVWDLMVGLIRGYSIQKKNIFTEHIEPLHARVLEIHKDYVRGFEEVRKHLTDRTVPTEKILEFLKERRRQYSVERDIAEELAKELRAAKRVGLNDEVWSALTSYCEAIIAYLSSATEVGGISWYTDFISGVEARVRMGLPDVWETIAISDNPRLDLLKKIDWNLDKGLEIALSPVNTYYAVLRTKLL